MKTKLQTALATIAPSIAIRTIWKHDTNEDDSIFSEGWALHGENPDDWQAWQSEVRATAIVNGEEVTGSAYLGGTWEKAGDGPATSNPEISGYENQMTVEALEDLSGKILGTWATVTLKQIVEAQAYCKAESAKEYDRQQAERAAPAA